jgi:hypothetical protein
MMCGALRSSARARPAPCAPGELVVLQVAQAAVDQLGATTRCARQVVLLAQQHLQAAAGQVARDAGAVDAATHHQHVTGQRERLEGGAISRCEVGVHRLLWAAAVALHGILRGQPAVRGGGARILARVNFAFSFLFALVSFVAHLRSLRKPVFPDQPGRRIAYAGIPTPPHPTLAHRERHDPQPAPGRPARRPCANWAAVSVEALAERFGVTLQTVRRDVKLLAEAGLLARFHGGVRLPARPPRTSPTASASPQRRRPSAASRAPWAGAGARRLLADPQHRHHHRGDGARAAGHRGLRVITNNLNVAAILSDNPIARSSWPAAWCAARDRGIVGEATVDFISQFRVDIG